MAAFLVFEREKLAVLRAARPRAPRFRCAKPELRRNSAVPRGQLLVPDHVHRFQYGQALQEIDLDQLLFLRLPCALVHLRHNHGVPAIGQRN